MYLDSVQTIGQSGKENIELNDAQNSLDTASQVSLTEEENDGAYFKTNAPKYKFTTTNGEQIRVTSYVFYPESNLVKFEQNGQQKELSIDDLQKIEEKNGSHWLEGLIGGTLGAVIGNAISRGDGEEWWYGAGSSGLIGAAIGTGVGLLIPKYKEVNLNSDAKLTFTGTGMRLSF